MHQLEISNLYDILYPVYFLCYTFFYTTDILFLLCFTPRRNRKNKNKLLSLLYYLNVWYIIVEKLNYLQ